MATTSEKSRVVHVIPTDGIGGVEVAARSMHEGSYREMEFHKCYIGRQVDVEPNGYYHQGIYSSANNPLNHLHMILLLRRLRPELIICSLWKSCVSVLLYKVFRPSCPLVIFLHSRYSSHILDGIFNWFAMLSASEIWVDSEATSNRVPDRWRGRVRIISFVTTRIVPPPPRIVSPTFIFWGRLHRKKGVDRALKFFAEVCKHIPDAQFTIIGRDDGQEDALKELSLQLRLEDRVRFVGEHTFEDIQELSAGYSFYLQLSRDEGMAMAVVEAMQLGLVPVVTPAGEIVNYCDDDVNSLIVGKNATETVDRLVRLAADRQRYAAMSAAAREHWRKRPLYREDVLVACRELISSNNRLKFLGL